jgi:hypothetical protein
MVAQITPSSWTSGERRAVRDPSSGSVVSFDGSRDDLRSPQDDVVFPRIIVMV